MDTISASKGSIIYSLYNKNSSELNIATTHKLEGDLKVDILQKSLNILFYKYPVLSTSYCIQNNELIAKTESINIELNIINFNNNESEIQLYLSDEINTPFVVDYNKLFRIKLLKLNKDLHLLHFTFHPLVFNLLSDYTFTHELSVIYNSLLSSNNIDSAINSSDFLSWLDKNIYNNNEQNTYWSDKLKYYPTEIKFPLDFKRKESDTNKASIEQIELSGELSNKLKVFNQQFNSSNATTLLSSLAILINRYSDDEDICISVPSNILNKSGFDNQISPSINNVIVRLDFNSINSIAQLLQNTQITLNEAFENPFLIIEDIVDAFNPAISSIINTPFKVNYTWLNKPLNSLTFNNISSERISINKVVSPYDLAFCLYEHNDIIKGEIIYNENIFRQETIVHLKLNFTKLLNSLCDNSGNELNKLSILSDYELKTLSDFNNTTVDVPNILAHNLFEKQVDIRPNDIAVICGEEQLTYKELEEKSNQLANFFISKNIKAGDVIGISIERSTLMAVSVLGCLKSGACYLPMDPAFPIDRLEYMFDDAGAKILLSQKSLIDRYTGTRDLSILIDSDWVQISACPKTRPSVKISNQSLTYLIYTSGSTGKPKGVEVHHEAVVNFINSMAKVPGMTQTDRLLAVTTLSFDISVLEMFLPLACGAQIVLAKPHEITNGEILAALLEKHNITILQATPATWAILINSEWKGKRNLRAFCGGEAISTGLARDIIPKVEALWNLYGPTETTVWSTGFQITNPNPPILVGKPIDNTQVHIISKHGNVQPVGVLGEVCIGGLGVTKGYHNRAELTNDKFIPGPDSTTMYKTGDLGRFLPDGNIELLGRIDNQIKLRGFRIEPGEIESLLCQMENIKEAVVKVQKFTDFDERLIAYLNVSEAYNLSNEVIIKSLSTRIPGYMIPSAFKIMHEFPRTPNGKIDKKQLIYELGEGDTSERKLIEPKNEIEKKIFDIWCDSLKSTNISTNDNFFNIGGHSLLAIPLVSKIEKTFSIELDLRLFFDHPTIQDLAPIVDSILNGTAQNKKPKQLGTDSLSNLLYIQPKGDKIPFTMVHGDQANYFISESLGKNQPFYGFFHLGSDGKKIQLNSTEKFAELYIKQLIEVVPTGPYYIGGFSYGCIIAYEMACQLQQMGREVPFLIMLDCNSSTTESPYKPPVTPKDDWHATFKYVKFKYLRPVYKYLKNVYWNTYFVLGIPLPTGERRDVIYAKYFKLSDKYTPGKRFKGKIHIFTATNNDKWRDPYPNWNDFGNDYNIYELEGDHRSILTNKATVDKIQKTIKTILG